MDAPILWQPDQKRIESAHISAFLNFVNYEQGLNLKTFDQLYTWSCAETDLFWQSVAKFCKVRFREVPEFFFRPGKQPWESEWCRGATLNFAENLLQTQTKKPALIYRREDGLRQEISYKDLRQEVAKTAAGMKAAGVGAGDRVAAILPNSPCAVIGMLAAASIGAVWSSCSPDFGVDAVLDRFGQIQPNLLISTTGHRFRGRFFDTLEKTRKVVEQIPSLTTVVITEAEPAHPFPNTGIPFITWEQFLSVEASELAFAPLPFDHPLYILYSSGTTGKPKGIVHRAGGVLLEHFKELSLHTDLHEDDVFFYQTTTGWMMWNFLVSGLALGASLLLYDGDAMAEGGRILFRIAEEEGVSIFGTNAKFLALIEKQGLRPNEEFQLQKVHTVLSTGSPLLPESYDFVYSAIGKEVCLSSISGGTDIVGCFALGCPILPVRRGELQCRSLGLAVDVFNNEGRSVVGERGELVCKNAFPSMPLGFWNDEDRQRFKAAYFERYDRVWTHGDFVELTAEGGMIFYGRSDATLNPGGVRIGTADIYSQVEQVPGIVEALAVGRICDGDEQIVLFIVLEDGARLTAELEQKIRAQIKENLSPFHVPKLIFNIPELPRTRSGKIVELAVKDLLKGKEPTNLSALQNPHAFDPIREIARRMGDSRDCGK